VDDSQGAGAFEVNEADAQEQRQEVGSAGPADGAADPEEAVGTLSGRDLESALQGANEADLAEQAQEVPYDDDFEQ
jgi:hypothetical protein